jgi:sugar/nucleoside kinase (ribokinase family)
LPWGIADRFCSDRNWHRPCRCAGICQGRRRCAGQCGCGIAAGFIGKLGDDAFGHFLVDTLKADNVDTSGIVLTKEALTGLAFVSLRADGEREFSFYRSPSADMLLSPSDLDQDMLKGCALFHYGTLCMIDDDPRAATLAAIDIARENGAIISCDPNLRLHVICCVLRLPRRMLSKFPTTKSPLSPARMILKQAFVNCGAITGN